jgi:hypothetical protein
MGSLEALFTAQIFYLSASSIHVTFHPALLDLIGSLLLESEFSPEDFHFTGDHAHPILCILK